MALISRELERNRPIFQKSPKIQSCAICRDENSMFHEKIIWVSSERPFC